MSNLNHLNAAAAGLYRAANTDSIGLVRQLCLRGAADHLERAAKTIDIVDSPSIIRLYTITHLYIMALELSQRVALDQSIERLHKRLCEYISANGESDAKAV